MNEIKKIDVLKICWIIGCTIGTVTRLLGMCYLIAIAITVISDSIRRIKRSSASEEVADEK